MNVFDIEPILATIQFSFSNINKGRILAIEPSRDNLDLCKKYQTKLFK